MLTRDELRKMERETLESIRIVAEDIAEEPNQPGIGHAEAYLGILVQQLMMLRRFILELPHSVN